MSNINEKILNDAMLFGAVLQPLDDDGLGYNYLEITEQQLVAFVKAVALAAIHDVELQRELMEE